MVLHRLCTYFFSLNSAKHVTVIMTNWTVNIHASTHRFCRLGLWRWGRKNQTVDDIFMNITSQIFKTRH